MSFLFNTKKSTTIDKRCDDCGKFMNCVDKVDGYNSLNNYRINSHRKLLFQHRCSKCFEIKGDLK